MFIITERQYKIIMHQAQACYPQESGGFLGGRENTILGVLPIPNKCLYDRTEVFALTDDDIDLAYKFLIKHKLEYLGIYHSHPKGVPYPSEQDLAHHQKYLFIVGLKDRYNPELYAWRVEGKKVYAEDIKIISDIGVTV
ncbi:MAG: M67 family metallopeptidase, partial [Candidatus Margulisiibacteriota bacterium]